MSKTKTIPKRAVGIGLSAQGLQGKQSIRTTFRLPDRTIKLLNVVAFQLGLKQKSLFDQLVEDEEVLEKLADIALRKSKQNDSGQRRQKTFVLSRRSLEVIERLSREKNVSRDFLVEISIQRLLPVFDAEQEKHKVRSIVYQDMKRHFEQGKKLLKKAENLLGEDDLIFEMIKKSNEMHGKNVAELKTIIEKGKAMDALDGINFLTEK